METRQLQFKEKIDLGGPAERSRKRRRKIIAIFFVAGWALGLFVFGWWLTPVAPRPATPDQLSEADRKAFVLALTDLYIEGRDMDRIEELLAAWPAADVEICQVAAELDDDNLAVRMTILATLLNGEGCMRVIYSQFDAAAGPGRHFTLAEILLIACLALLLGGDIWLMRLVAGRLSIARRKKAREQALTQVFDDGSSGHILSRFTHAPLTIFVLRRLVSIPITLFIISIVIFAIIFVADPSERASLYLPPNTPSTLSPQRQQQLMDQLIAEHGLSDPFPIQYARWVGNLLRGDWGWSPLLQGPVLPALLRRSGVTLELTLYSLLFFLPLGLFSGVLAGWRAGTRRDLLFRASAFVAASLPPFILGMFLLSIFYVGLKWFPPGRTSIYTLSLSTSDFVNYTGLLTIDGLLNGRLDVARDALRHLVLPVFVLSLFHWATVARITRTSIIEVKDQDYITAARARGIRPSSLLWHHSLRNALTPGLTNSSMAIASLVTGVFVIEVIFQLHGLSELALLGMQRTPDAALTLGFAVYTALLVLPFMFVLDIIRGVLDPRGNLGEV
jgi:ABC-type dipeptide/oligopeptide/nickel transport system permease component